MGIVSYTRQGDIGIVTLDDGKANAMSRALIAGLMSALDEAEADTQARAVVIAGREKFYSAGLDLRMLLSMSRAELVELIGALPSVMGRVFLFPKPVVGAAAGHALAGGMLLLLACDRRVALDDDTHKYGLTEVAIGMPMSTWVIRLAEHGVPSHLRDAVIQEAQTFTAKSLHGHGIVHELASSREDVLPRAIAMAGSLTRLPTYAYALTKQRMRKPGYDASLALAPAELEVTLSTGPLAMLK